MVRLIVKKKKQLIWNKNTLKTVKKHSFFIVLSNFQILLFEFQFKLALNLIFNRFNFLSGKQTFFNNIFLKVSTYHLTENFAFSKKTFDSQGENLSFGTFLTFDFTKRRSVFRDKISQFTKNSCFKPIIHLEFWNLAFPLFF